MCKRSMVYIRYSALSCSVVYLFGQTVGLCFWKRRQVVELSHTPAALKIEEPAIPKRAMAN